MCHGAARKHGASLTPLDPETAFGELAARSLDALYPERSVRSAVARAILFKLSLDSSLTSRPCVKAGDRWLFVTTLYAGHDLRILFGKDGGVHVWSVTAIKVTGLGKTGSAGERPLQLLL